MGIGLLLYLNNNSQAETDPATIKNEIAKFLGTSEITIEKKVELNDKYQAILFTKYENIGYAILEGNNVVTVTDTDNERLDDTFKNFLIFFGKKPSINNTKLNVTIDLGNNRKDLKKSLNLEEGKYYLNFVELSKDVNAKVFEEYEFK